MCTLCDQDENEEAEEWFSYFLIYFKIYADLISGQGLHINNLRLADDIDIIVESCDRLQALNERGLKSPRGTDLR